MRTRPRSRITVAAMSLLRAFVRFNRSLSQGVARHLPQARTNPYEEYLLLVGQLMNAAPHLTVADIGGGKQCGFARYRDPRKHTKIIAVDISGEELVQNSDVDDKRVADVTVELPFAHGEVDLIVSRSVLEHLPDVEAFIRVAADRLREGAFFVGRFPSKFSVTALLNQILPSGISARLLRMFIPASEGRLGFPAFYDRCYPSAMVKILRKNGFAVTDVRAYYHHRDYYYGFFPLFLLTAVYEYMIMKCGAKNLAASVLVVAQRSGVPGSQARPRR
jgi:SAM-dependent methyltransferase